MTVTCRNSTSLGMAAAGASARTAPPVSVGEDSLASALPAGSRWFAIIAPTLIEQLPQINRLRGTVAGLSTSAAPLAMIDIRAGPYARVCRRDGRRSPSTLAEPARRKPGRCHTGARLQPRSKGGLDAAVASLRPHEAPVTIRQVNTLGRSELRSPRRSATSAGSRRAAGRPAVRRRPASARGLSGQADRGRNPLRGFPRTARLQGIHTLGSASSKP